MVRHLAGDITEVVAFSAGPKRDLNFQYDPVYVAAVRFQNGALGKLSTLADGDTPYIFNIRLFGTEGTIQNNSVYSSTHYPGSLDYWSFPTIKPDSGDVAHHPFVPEVAHFMDCIENDVESHASIHDAYRSMAVVFAIEESAAQAGRPVLVRNEQAGAVGAGRVRCHRRRQGRDAGSRGAS
jgi:UDP-N-acetyl-2-amino-2-deoxyglucuronate dehydrogenase